MADVALKTGLLSDAARAEPASVKREGSFIRGLLFAIVLSVPAWAVIAALIVLLI